MPLPLLNDGEKQTIKQINGNDKVKSHLASLGFCVGEHVTMVSKCHGDVILKIKESRIALSGSMANRIIVEGALG